MLVAFHQHFTKAVCKAAVPCPQQGVDPALSNIISDMDNGVESTHSKNQHKTKGSGWLTGGTKTSQRDLDRLARWV